MRGQWFAPDVENCSVMADFFISYTGIDKSWAEWIAWVLEDDGFEVILQAWDFLPGKNFVLEMHAAAAKATQTIAVLSPEYLASGFAAPEWAAAFARDPTGAQQRVLPVRVRQCQVEGLLAPVVYIDLVGLDEVTAKQALLDGARGRRAKPAVSPAFPGHAPSSLTPPSFPGISGTAARQSPGRFMPRIRQAFSDLDKSNHIESAFETIFRQFESRLSELSGQYSGVQYRLRPVGAPRATEFEVEIFVNGQRRALCGVGLRDQFGQPGIVYSEKGLGWGGYNDRLTVSDDPYDLALETTFGGLAIGGVTEGLDLARLSPEAAAEYLWRRLAHQLEW
jgi:TIR domain